MISNIHLRKIFRFQSCIILCIGLNVAAQQYSRIADIPYDTIPSVDQKYLSLDIYKPIPDTSLYPVVIYVHGGGFTYGDKDDTTHKVSFFCSHGFIFLSVNYRLQPDSGTTLRHPMQVTDVSSAIAWAWRNINQYHGDKNNLFLMGHSAGAHLVSLVATNERFLIAQGLTLQVLRGDAPLDPVGVNLFHENIGYTVIFGSDSSSKVDASPALQCSPGKSIPPFMILHNTVDSSMQARAAELADSLASAGVEVHNIAATGKDHSGLNNDFGNPVDSIGMMEADSVLNFFQHHMVNSNQIRYNHSIPQNDRFDNRHHKELPVILSGRLYKKVQNIHLRNITRRIYRSIND
jgi:arylformamidase